MSEDGELSDSSPQSNKNQDDDGDGFIIDRSFSMIVEEEEKDSEVITTTITSTTTSEDVTAIKKDSGDSEDVKKSSGGTSEWQKQMRRRLLEEVDPTEEAPAPKRRRINLCFNCRGEHSISQCPEPKDFAAIRKNKQEFLAQNNNQNGGKNGQGGRISKITDEAGKEAKFKPGRISQNLRDALSLGPDDIPEWIYRMRRMGFYDGYPPGHLRKALKYEYETLKIFTEDSKPKTSSEDPEDDARPCPKIQEKSLHYYNGFNRTYHLLRDLDERRFEIPPWDTFCGMLQEQVTKNHEISERHRIRDARDRRAELQRERRRQEEEQKASEEVKEDSEELPTSSTATMIMEDEKKRDVTPEREVGPNGEDEDEEEMKERMGESIHQLIGTPILSRRDASGVWIAPSTPTLEQFAVGIVPFEAKEEEKPRGIFKKIMSIFRGKGKEEEEK